MGISSPDKGCEQYADWWEVISEDEKLIFRRILGHSHVNEQPFVRSGGGINISKDQIVFLRAHMNNAGNGVSIFKGSVSAGFSATVIASDFAKAIETEEPQPGTCAF